MLNEENLRWSMGRLNKKAAPGVDRVDYQTYSENLEENVKDLGGLDTLLEESDRMLLIPSIAGGSN